MDEIWKPIGFKNYEASNYGNIKGRRGKLLKLHKRPDGYLSVGLSGSGTFQVHYLILKAFVGERPEKADIDHINRIKDDNQIENLRYCTRSENLLNTNRTRTDILETNSYERSLLRNKINQRAYREKKVLDEIIIQS